MQCLTCTAIIVSEVELVSLSSGLHVAWTPGPHGSLPGSSRVLLKGGIPQGHPVNAVIPPSGANSVRGRLSRGMRAWGFTSGGHCMNMPCLASCHLPICPPMGVQRTWGFSHFQSKASKMLHFGLVHTDVIWLHKSYKEGLSMLFWSRPREQVFLALWATGLCCNSAWLSYCESSQRQMQAEDCVPVPS